MKNKQKWFILLGLVASLLLIGIGAVWAQNSSILRFSVGAGGGGLSTGNLQLRSSVGQPLAGAVRNNSSGLNLCAGLECGAAPSTSSATGTPTPTPTVTVTPTPTATATGVSTETPTPTATSIPASGEGNVYLPLISR